MFFHKVFRNVNHFFSPEQKTSQRIETLLVPCFTRAFHSILDYGASKWVLNVINDAFRGLGLDSILYQYNTSSHGINSIVRIKEAFSEKHVQEDKVTIKKREVSQVFF